MRLQATFSVLRTAAEDIFKPLTTGLNTKLRGSISINDYGFSDARRIRLTPLSGSTLNSKEGYHNTGPPGSRARTQDERDWHPFYINTQQVDLHSPHQTKLHPSKETSSSSPPNMQFTNVLSLFMFAAVAAAICPGYNYGIADNGPVSGGRQCRYHVIFRTGYGTNK
jgi:hypothetical protein